VVAYLYFCLCYSCSVASLQHTHDSIEDARTALQLYLQYVKLQRDGTLQQCLHALYEQGHRSGFKV